MISAVRTLLALPFFMLAIMFLILSALIGGEDFAGSIIKAFEKNLKK